MKRRTGLQLGLCCAFSAEPIKFRTTTVTHLLKLSRREQLDKLALLCMENTNALSLAIEYCGKHGIGSFRVMSQVLPCKTHPVVGYAANDLPDGLRIVEAFQRCGALAAARGVRLGFHPDQFVVLNSPREEVVRSSIAELEYQAEVAEWIGADTINIHAGGGFGDLESSIARWERSYELLSDRVRARLTVENDDRIYTPRDLLPLCGRTGVPLVYDAHHHRCLADGMTVEEATDRALSTWNRRPLFHISSPQGGWSVLPWQPHHDYIDVVDFPDCWRPLDLTVEVEAKQKELAIARLQRDLCRTGRPGKPAKTARPRARR